MSSDRNRCRRAMVDSLQRCRPAALRRDAGHIRGIRGYLRDPSGQACTVHHVGASTAGPCETFLAWCRLETGKEGIWEMRDVERHWFWPTPELIGIIDLLCMSVYNHANIQTTDGT